MTAQGNVVSFPGGKKRKRPQSEIERLITERYACRQKAVEYAQQAESIASVLQKRHLDDLPFIGPCPEGRLGWQRRNYWVDEPTEDGADHARGRRYALMFLDLRSADSAVTARSFELIIQSMIRQGIARRKKGGRYSRSVATPSMEGFLFEIGRFLVGLPPLDRRRS
jgi:hypothetical protein